MADFSTDGLTGGKKMQKAKHDPVTRVGCSRHGEYEYGCVRCEIVTTTSASKPVTFTIPGEATPSALADLPIQREVFEPPKAPRPKPVVVKDPHPVKRKPRTPKPVKIPEKAKQPFYPYCVCKKVKYDGLQCARCGKSLKWTLRRCEDCGQALLVCRNIVIEDRPGNHPHSCPKAS